MCGFERPGKTEHQAAAVQAQASARPDTDSGWRTASAARKQPPPSAGNNPGGAASGKSKAQSKNEKRRAKKRADGSFE